MIIGYVRNGMPRLGIRCLGARGEAVIEFTVDTAFEGGLALPTSALARLDARFLSDAPISLADGSRLDAALFEVIIWWDGQQRPAEALSLGSEGSPLLGVELLVDHYVTMEMTDGGEVTMSAR